LIFAGFQGRTVLILQVKLKDTDNFSGFDERIKQFMRIRNICGKEKVKPVE